MILLFFILPPGYHTHPFNGISLVTMLFPISIDHKTCKLCDLAPDRNFNKMGGVYFILFYFSFSLLFRSHRKWYMMFMYTCVRTYRYIHYHPISAVMCYCALAGTVSTTLWQVCSCVRKRIKSNIVSNLTRHVVNRLRWWSLLSYGGPGPFLLSLSQHNSYILSWALHTPMNLERLEEYCTFYYYHYSNC